MESTRQPRAKLAERLGVPRENIYRKKQGFAVPMVHWFRGELKTGLHDVLTDSRTLAEESRSFDAVLSPGVRETGNCCFDLGRRVAGSVGV